MRRLTTSATLAALFLFGAVSQASPLIHMGRFRLAERLVITKSDYEVKYVFNRDIGRGRIVKMKNGKEGRTYVRFAIVKHGDETLKESKIKTTVIPSEPAVFHIGPDGYATSRGSFTRASYRRMESTAYPPDAGLGARATFTTATGRRARYGVIAVDPRQIPLHSLVYVEGYGFAVAADTGGAIKGNIIDVCLPDEQTCRNWGRRMVNVHVFREKLRRSE